MVAHHRSEHALIKKRMEITFLLYLGVMVLLAARLAYLQGLQGRGFQEVRNKMQGRDQEMPARRGRILDRNGAELAADVIGKAIAINPRVVADPAATAARIGELLKLSEAQTHEMKERIAQGKARRRAYSQLRRGVDRRLAESVYQLSKKDPALRGLWLEDSPMRVNPGGQDGIQLVGSVSTDGRGVEATELMFERVLAGIPGRRRVRVDATGANIPKSELILTPPHDGRDVRLTIDRDVQHFVEQEVAKVCAEQRPNAGTSIVMDVQTGEVLGMASWPSYNPSQKTVKPDQRRNRAVTDMYEPGSIFKVVTAAAALESGVSTHAYCGGSQTIGNRTIKCAHGAHHGATDMRKMLELSCNIAAANLAMRVGPERMYDFLTRFGFQEKTGVEFPGEHYWMLRKPDKWRPIRTANIGFGQGIMVSPIQMLAAYCAVANDGVYVPPRLVLDAPGADLPERKPRRVMSSEHAAQIRRCMEGCVERGTGKGAKIPGYSVAGKTGTAQIVENGHYGDGYLASFIGFLPADRPKLAILVSVWHPRKDEYGGTVSAPVFREIARQTVAYMKLPPDSPDDPRDGGDPGSFRRYARNGGPDR